MKKRIYVIGHIHPDTDSICGAISYAYLLRMRHKHDIIAARAGELNPETKFVLKKWKVKAPIRLSNARGKNLIIIDHNEIDQAVNGIKDANVLEIVDHHRIGDVETIHPIPFENEPRGSTTSIIAERYDWFKIPISKKMAGIMLSGLISDTLMLKSPTTKPKDKVLARKLAKIAGVNLKKYGKEMLEANCDLINHSAKKIILTDFKTYSHHGKKIGIGQVPVIGFKKALMRKEELLDELIKIKKKNYSAVFLIITDILKGNSYLLFAGDKNKIHKIFHKKVVPVDHDRGIMYLKGVVSRKKQVQPKVLMLF